MFAACRPVVDVDLSYADWYAGVAIDPDDGALVGATTLERSPPSVVANDDTVDFVVVGFAEEDLEPLGEDFAGVALVAPVGCAQRLPTPIVAVRLTSDGATPFDAERLPGLSVAGVAACDPGFACVEDACVERVRDVAVADSHSCAILGGGNVRCWGLNDYGETGVERSNTFTLQAVDVPIIDDAIAISGGWHHTCAIRADRTVWCWGDNQNNQLGAASPERSSSPVLVPGVEGAVAIDASGHHTCAIVDGGDVWCFGANERGQLGDGTTAPRAGPIRIEGITDAEDVALGSAHTCVRSSDDRVRCFGMDLGANDREFEAVMIDAGNANTCGVDADGDVFCVGMDFFGSRAAGSFTPAGPVQEIALGGNWGCVVLEDETTTCWGTNEVGQRRQPSILAFELDRPMPLPNLGPVRDLELGWGHACYLDEEQRVRCWGWNGHAQLGRGHRDGVLEPEKIAVDGVAVASGRHHTCVLSNVGEVTCFGAAQSYQLGDGKQAVRAGPQTAAIEDVVEIDAGLLHTCARKSDNSMWCWGENADYQLGTEERDPTGMVRAPVDDVRGIAVGARHTCAIVGDAGEVWCWGDNTANQLGPGNGVDTPIPVRAEGVVGARAIAAGYYGACALVGTQVRCWGTLAGGRQTIDTLTDPIAIGAGHRFRCAIERDGSVWCWGENVQGSLGNGTTTNSDQPVRIQGVTGIVGMALNASHVCAYDIAGGVFCWGDNTWFQMGDGTDVDRPTPARQPGVSGVRAGDAGESHTCVADADDDIWCWGLNEAGQSGVALEPLDAQPGLVQGLP